ncbi:DRTGG domain-containing protein [Vallitalea sp.]|jgi:predicted transcriptional regulator|uniref:DRTGG domain-containing protein n=1 Tax=Vallitalea sp. TaxID=1882829 RepID=UPI0025F993CD|nr:DRTGG domain-containing protein [Vallitalea sp.]MCT4688930.1 DRTGG domain-containing protein [Vallitalea sp.]
MIVEELKSKLNLELVAGKEGLQGEIKGGFVGDLLSVVMGKAKEGNIWITIQSHVNIVAVAVLTGSACIIVSEGFKVEEDAIIKANEENIPILTTKKSSFEMVSDLVALGIKNI